MAHMHTTIATIDYEKLSVDFAYGARAWRRCAVILAKRIHDDHEPPEPGSTWHDCNHPACVNTRDTVAAAADAEFGL